MSNIDKLIKEHLEDEKGAILSICLTGESGSFKLPKGVRLVLREGSDVECSENEGKNQLDLVKCSDATVKDFSDGVLRIEQCDSVKEISCKEKATLNAGDTEFEKLDLEKSQATLMGCKFQEAKFEKSKIESFKNKFEGKLEVTGGNTVSYEDEFEDDLDVSEKASFILQKAQLKGDITFDKSSLKSDELKAEGESEFTGSTWVDNAGEFQDKVTISDKSQIVCTKTKFQDDLTIESSSFNGTGIECEKKLDVSEGTLLLKGLQAKDKVSITDTKTVLTGAKCEDDVETEDSAIRLLDCEFEGKFEAQGGAIDSEKCKFNDKFTFNSGTLTSSKDEFSDDLECEDLIHRNTIWAPESAKKVTLSGQEGKATIEISGMEAEEVDLSKFARVILNDCQLEQLTLSEIQHIELNKCQIETLSQEQCSSTFLNTSGIEEWEAEDCGQCFAGDAEVQTATLTNIGLAVTCDIGELTCEDSTINDAGSTFVDAKSSILNCIGSDVTGEDVILTITGGSYELTGDSVVVSNGADGSNLEGLTLGKGFTSEEQAVCLLVEGTGQPDGLLQASFGRLTLKSLIDDVYIEAPVGNIVGTALLSVDLVGETEAVTLTAGTMIDMLAGQDIIQAAGMSISCTSGTDIMLTAGAALDASAGANTQIASAGNTVIMGASAEVIGDNISIIGQTEFM